MALWNKKKKEEKSKISVPDILNQKDGQDAIIDIDNLLSPIFYSKPEMLSEEEKIIVFIEELEREMNSGGFNQFFFNSAGDFYSEILSALKQVGSVKFYNILKQSSKPFPNESVPTDRKKRQEILEEIEDKADKLWDDLDQEFYKYEEDIYGLLINFINKNIEKFR
jgi:hypothetical protein